MSSVTEYTPRHSLKTTTAGQRYPRTRCPVVAVANCHSALAGLLCGFFLPRLSSCERNQRRCALGNHWPGDELRRVANVGGARRLQEALSIS